jgi:hypothetical protein
MQSLSEKRSEIGKITHNPEVSGSKTLTGTRPHPAAEKSLHKGGFWFFT